MGIHSPSCQPAFRSPLLPMTASETDSSRSLAAHVEVLYALARVLAGSDGARSLVQSVYQHAAEVPPEQRPSDERAWLFRLMVDVREGDLHSAGAEVHPAGDTSFTNDPFRREVAEQTAERMLPTAFAACSLHERFILAIDVLGNPSDEVLAAALDTTTANAGSVRDQARSSLRASLRDVLKGPERMLVDVALPETALRDQLRDLLMARFHPAPDDLHSTVTEVLERAQAERLAQDSDPAASSRSLLPWGLDVLWNWASVRGVLSGLGFLLIVTAGIGGANYLISSSSPPPAPAASIVDISVQRADGVQPALDTPDPERAAAFIRRTWNRRVSVPTIQNASLNGVGRLSMEMNTEVPVLRYRDDDSGASILAFAFNYALMDSLGERATLDRQRRAKLASNQHVLTAQRSDRAVLLWRQRDDIFVIVAPNTDADSLRARIQL